MNLTDYQELAARTRNPKMTHTEHLTNGGLGVAGEAGEVANKVKKIVHHRHFNEIGALWEELGDVLWYLADLCTTLGVSLDTVAQGNIAKLKRRYPDGFSAERSINRDDGPASLNEVANEHVVYHQPREGLTIAATTNDLGYSALWDDTIVFKPYTPISYKGDA